MAGKGGAIAAGRMPVDPATQLRSMKKEKRRKRMGFWLIQRMDLSRPAEQQGGATMSHGGGRSIRRNGSELWKGRLEAWGDPSGAPKEIGTDRATRRRRAQEGAGRPGRAWGWRAPPTLAHKGRQRTDPAVLRRGARAGAQRPLASAPPAKKAARGAPNAARSRQRRRPGQVNRAESEGRVRRTRTAARQRG